MRKFKQLNSLTSIALLHDIIVVVLAWWFSYLLRFNFAVPVEHYQHIVPSLVWIVPLQIAVFVALGLYRGVWRFASDNDLKRIVFAVIIATAFASLVLQANNVIQLGRY
jgi:FlaA1/EpsC-like NDP-sugar epimerase